MPDVERCNLVAVATDKFGKLELHEESESMFRWYRQNYHGGITPTEAAGATYQDALNASLRAWPDRELHTKGNTKGGN